jgi:hypothetical protein
MGCGDIASFPSEVIAARAARGVGVEEASP